MLSRIEEWRLGRLRDKYGPHTPESALEEAVHMEEIKLLLDPLDPVRSRFAKLQADLETYASLLERS